MYELHHVSLEFRHIVPLSQPVSVPLCLEQWHSMSLCLSVRHSLTLRLSVCLSALTLSVIAGCVPICLAIYLQYQTVYPVCIWQLMCYFVFASEWCHSGAVCQGRKPRCHHLLFFFILPFLLSSDTFQSGFSVKACTYASKKTCNMSTSTGMHLCTLDGIV